MRTLRSLGEQKQVLVVSLAPGESSLPAALREQFTANFVLPDSQPTLTERQRVANLLCDSMSNGGTDITNVMREGQLLIRVQFSFPFFQIIFSFLDLLRLASSSNQPSLALWHLLKERLGSLEKGSAPSLPFLPPVADKETDRRTGSLFSDIAGMTELKQTLVETILWPRKYPDLFKKHGLRTVGSGLLLFGPPGSFRIHFCL